MRSVGVGFAFTVPFSYGLPLSLRTIWTAGLLLYLAVVVAITRFPSFPRSSVWLAAALMAAGASVVTYFGSLNPVAHRRAAVPLVTLWALAPPVIAWLRRAATWRRYVVAFVAGQSLSALVALIVAVSGRSIFGSQVGIGRTEGLAGHPNILGVLAAVVCLVWFDAILRREPTGQLHAVGALNLVALVLSGSLSAAAAMMCGAVVLAFGRRVRAQVVLRVCLAGAVVVVGGSLLASAVGYKTPLDRVRQTSGQTADVSTVGERWRTWQFAISAIERHPLDGVGLDDRSGATDVRGIVVHNVLLRAWFQGGPLFGLAMLAVVGSSAALVWTALRRHRDVLAAGVLTLVTTFSFTSAAMNQPYFWLLHISAWTSLALGLRRRGAHAPVDPPPSGRTRSRRDAVPVAPWPAARPTPSRRDGAAR